MARPAEGYRLADGTRVPGTTTITGRFKESGGLLQWAFQQGRSGVATLYEKRDEAADAGTLAHRMVELHASGKSDDEIQAALKDGKASEQAFEAYCAYLSWERMTRLRVVEQEISLVSEAHRFGGTIDAIGVLDNKLALLDWKSGGVYSDALVQVAAYRELWNENRPDQPLEGGLHICRFAKEKGDFTHRFFPNLDDGWALFKLYREAYEIDKVLAKRVK